MVSSIGNGLPEGPAYFRWPEEAVVLEALSTMIPPKRIRGVLQATGRGEKRIRKLPAAAVVWLVIALGIWGDANVPAIWRRLTGMLRALLGAWRRKRPPVKSAFSEARRRLGAGPMRQLFRQTAGPMATAQTHGAFYRGMRMHAIDGVHLDIPDTAANAKAFGRPSTTRNGEWVAGGYPQILVVDLIEVGTHAIREALIRPATAAEPPVAHALLKDVGPGDLLLWDTGFYSYALLAGALGRGAHVLGRVPSGVILKAIKRLSDGSYLAKVYDTPYHRLTDRGGLVVRVIEYTLNDSARPGHQQRHRLITTLLDEKQYPALELICLYHERWEIEIANDELKTHQLARWVDLRSLTPWGVVQELYGVLLAYNAVRGLMHEAAMGEQIDPRRLSFLDSVRIIRDTISVMRDEPTACLPILYQGMLHLIAQCRLPQRENRINPRVIKKKMSKWPKKRPQHCRLPQPTKPFHEAVAMLN
jgi:hypothetical protein